MRTTKSAGFGASALILLLMVVVMVGLGAYMVIKRQPSAQKTTTNSATENEETEITADMKTTTLTQGSTTVTVEHPSAWEVKDKTVTFEDPELVLPAVYIKSAKGHYLHLKTSAGVGGDCQSNDYTYILTKKLATATPDVYFTQYSTTDPSFPVHTLSVEDFRVRNAGNTAVNEGDSATDTCTMPSYSVVGGNSSADSIFVGIKDNDSETLGSGLTFEGIEGDPEFIAMLQSLRVTP